MIDLEKIKEKILVLKQENDKANETLRAMSAHRDRLMSEALVRNGRIMELTELLESLETKKEGE